MMMISGKKSTDIKSFLTELEAELDGITAASLDEKIEKNYGEQDEEDLLASYKQFVTLPAFEMGQLVKWKKGFKNKKYPHETQPAVVVDILSDPLKASNKESGSPYFNEPLDIALGFLDSDGDFLIYHYDKRRFESYK
jgi:hypothetical protein